MRFSEEPEGQSRYLPNATVLRASGADRSNVARRPTPGYMEGFLFRNVSMRLYAESWFGQLRSAPAVKTIMTILAAFLFPAAIVSLYLRRPRLSFALLIASLICATY